MAVIDTDRTSNTHTDRATNRLADGLADAGTDAQEGGMGEPRLALVRRGMVRATETERQSCVGVRLLRAGVHGVRRSSAN